VPSPIQVTIWPIRGRRSLPWELVQSSEDADINLTDARIIQGSYHHIVCIPASIGTDEVFAKISSHNGRFASIVETRWGDSL
jgi:hypothetical protein